MAHASGSDCDENYLRWVEQGFIRTCPGAAIEPELIAVDIRELFDDRDVRRCGYDAWGIDRLR
jgi:phage terminase large subunit-like protein